MSKTKRFLTTFSIGSTGYSILEIVWRGYTHWTMSITGGVCFWLYYLTNRKLARKSIWERCFCGSAIITSVEFVVGCLVNKVFHLNVWDYSRQRFNLGGQICLLYSVLWFFLCIPLTYLCKQLSKRETSGAG